MKYGLLKFLYEDEVQQKVETLNLGDAIQVLAWKEVYRQAGIQEKDIVYIAEKDLASYDGEYVIFPVSAIGVGSSSILSRPFSPKIIPFFFSTNLASLRLEPAMIDYMRNFGPVGCRDEFAMQQLRQLQIPAYLSGCVTAVFPRPEGVREKNKTFLIDVPESLYPYIPPQLLENSEKITHLFPIDHSRPATEEDAERFFKEGCRLFERYKKEAGLIISSRMHGLMPGISMGIPVIAAMENRSRRFSWLDKFVPLYTPDLFSRINWSPKPVEYEAHKQLLTRHIIQRLRELAHKWEDMTAVSQYYEDRPKSIYGSRYHQLLLQLGKKREDPFEYVLWGCGLTGESTYLAMRELYPNAVLKAAVDQYAVGEFHGLPIQKAEVLEKYPKAFILLANYAGRKMGYETMQKLGKTEGKDFLYLGTTNG